MNASLGPYEVLSDIVVNPNVDSQKYVYSSHQGDMLSDTTCFEHSQWIPDIGRNESSLNDSHYNAFDNMIPRCDSHDTTWYMKLTIPSTTWHMEAAVVTIPSTT